MENDLNNPVLHAEYRRYRTRLRKEFAAKFAAPFVLSALVCLACLFAVHKYLGMPAEELKLLVIYEFRALAIASGVISVIAAGCICFLRFKPFRG